MFFILNKNSKGQAVIEFTVLILFVVFALVIMQKYAARSLAGRWKTVGDSFGSGRQYSYGKTLQCDYDPDFDVWYNVVCYEEQCDCTSDLAVIGERCDCKDPPCTVCNQAKAYWVDKCRHCKKHDCKVDACQ